MSLSGYADPEYGVESYASGGPFIGGRLPRCGCWISFTTDPGDEPVWEDVSLYLRAFSIRRGRQYELDQFSAGTATITLDNRDRRFDPDYASSPYYPNVIPMRRVKITAQWGIEHTVYDGYIDGWPQSYNQPNEARVDVPATDAFKVLSLAQMPESVYAYEVLQDSPVHWWRLNEQQGTTAPDSGSNPVTANMTGVLQYSVVGSSPYDSGTGMGFVDPNADGGGFFSVAAPITTGDFTIEFWLTGVERIGTPLCQTPLGTTNKRFARTIYWEFATDGTTIIDGSGNYVSSSGRVRFTSYDSSGNALVQSSSGDLASLATAGWHHIVVTRSGSTVTLYTDGVARDSDTHSSAYAGGVIMGPMSDYGAGEVVELDELAIYNTALSSSRVLAHYEAAVDGWTGESTDPRIERALDLAGFSSTDRDLATGQSTMGAAVLNSQSTLAHIQEAELAEGGAFYISADGTATFKDRHYLLTTPGSESQAVFGDEFL